MKKFFLATTIFTLLVSFVSAQAIRFGFSGGVAVASMQDKTTDEKNVGSYRPGVTFGILVDAPMQKNGSFQPGLNFVQRGTESVINEINGQKTEYHLSYVEIPLNVVFNIHTSNGKVLLGGGPVGGFGFSGTSFSKVNGVSTQKRISFGNGTTNDLKGIDFGLNAIAGYQLKSGLFATVNYTQGISTLILNGGDHKLFNRYFAFRFGYLLKEKMKSKTKGKEKGKK